MDYMEIFIGLLMLVFALQLTYLIGGFDIEPELKDKQNEN